MEKKTIIERSLSFIALFLSVGTILATIIAFWIHIEDKLDSISSAFEKHLEFSDTFVREYQSYQNGVRDSLEGHNGRIEHLEFSASRKYHITPRDDTYVGNNGR